MADPASPSTETGAEAAPAAVAAVKPSILSKFNVLLILLAVVMAECILAFLCLPGAAPASAAPSEPADDQSQEKRIEAFPTEEAKEERKAEEGKAKQSREVKRGKGADEVETDLGQFTVTAFQPSAGSTLYIEFHLYGTVAIDQLAAFNAAMEENKHRFRDQIIVIMRSSDLTDYTDAQLGLIKRKILEKSNQILGKPYLRSIIFSDFSFIEQ